MQRTIIRDGDNTPLNSAVDGQRFIVRNNAESSVADEPVITIDNENVTVRNRGDLSTSGDTPTILVEPSGDAARIDNLGSITSDQSAIQIEALDARITNQTNGVIDGGFNGVNFTAEGETDSSLTNRGSITSDSRAVNLDGDGILLRNFGDIVGTGDQRNGTVYVDGSGDNFVITNSPQGLIDAGIGNNGSGISVQVGTENGDVRSGTILNQGDINGRGEAALADLASGVRLFNGAGEGTVTFEGLIANLNTGSITTEAQSGVLAGVLVQNGVNFQGTLSNEGDIFGPNNGVYFGTGDHSGGLFENSGTVSSDSRAVNIDGIGLDVVNVGEILGTGDQRNGTVYSDNTADLFSIENLGLIDAGEGNNGAAISLSLGATLDATVFNSGTIAGRGQAAAPANTAGDGIRLSSGVEGESTFTGEIINSGEITSESGVGPVGGFRSANGVNFQGELINEAGGVISGPNNGVYFGTGDHSGGLFENDGLVTSDSRAVNIDGIGLEVVNSGEILGTGDQRNGTVYSDNTSDLFSIDNQGLIDAGEGNDGAAISLSLGATLNATVENSGTIAGRGQAAAPANTAGDGIRLSSGVEGESTFTGEITNSGEITSESGVGPVGGFRSANGVNFQGELINEADGVISGVNNGVYFGTGDHSGGLFQNDGLVTSDSRAVNLDGEGLEFVNNGEILGTGDQRNGTVYQDGTGNNISITNETGATIDAGAGNSGSGISIQVGAVNGDVITGSISNDGLVQGRGDGNVPAGVRLFTNTEESTYSGDIFNGPNGVIASETSAGILIEDGVVFNGTITNEGTISSVVGDAIDASGAEGDITVLNSGLLDGVVRLGSGDDSLVTSQLVQFDGGEGNDTLDFSSLGENASGGAFNGVIVDLDVNSAGAAGTPSQDGAVLDLPPAAGGQQIADLEVDDVENLVGSDFNDGLFGNNEVNVLESGAGNDLIHGFAGDDFLSGGADVDTVLFSAAPAGVVVDLNDQVSEAEFDAILAGDIASVIAASGGAGNNVLSGFENVTGSQSDDTITGDSGANVLNGNGGNDSLAGGGGNDTLIGGAGLDSFEFDFGTGRDEVVDFNGTEDFLELSAFGFANVGEVQAASQVLGGNLVIDLGGVDDQVTLLGVDDVNTLTDANVGLV
ncbi:MAG: calcium-binding protein [Pseudomonadota bacterium]